MGKIIKAGLAAFAGAGCAFVLVVFVTAAFISGEASYGWGLIFSPLAAFITGAVIFVVALRRLHRPQGQDSARRQ